MLSRIWKKEFKSGINGMALFLTFVWMHAQSVSLQSFKKLSLLIGQSGTQRQWSLEFMLNKFSEDAVLWGLIISLNKTETLY